MKFTVDTAAMRVLDVEPEICRVPLKSRDQLSAGRYVCNADDSLLQTTKTPAGVPIGTKLTTATRDMPHDRTDSYRLSEVGTLVCASFAEAYRNAAGRKDKDVTSDAVISAAYAQVFQGQRKCAGGGRSAALCQRTEGLCLLWKTTERFGQLRLPQQTLRLDAVGVPLHQAQ